MGTKTPPRCTEQQSRQDNSERNTALVERSCQTSITPAGAPRSSWQPQISVDDGLTVAATRIGCGAAPSTLLLAIPRRNPPSRTRCRTVSVAPLGGRIGRCPSGRVHAEAPPRLRADYEDQLRCRKIDPSHPVVSGGYEGLAGGHDDPHGLRESADAYDWPHGGPLRALARGSPCRSSVAHESRIGRCRTALRTTDTLAGGEGYTRSPPSLPECGNSTALPELWDAQGVTV
jgi:hypothetical protein